MGAGTLPGVRCGVNAGGVFFHVKPAFPPEKMPGRPRTPTGVSASGPNHPNTCNG